MVKIRLKVKNLAFCSACCCILTLALLMSVACEEGIGDYLEGKNEALKDDATKYIHALEKFDTTNSSFEALTTAVKNFFKYIHLQRPDELSSILFAYPLLRPDLFPLAQERRDSSDGSPFGKSNVLIKRKDGTLFNIFPFRPGVAWMLPLIKESEGKKILYQGVEDPVDHLVVVQFDWDRSEKYIRNRTFAAKFHWDKLDDDKHVAVVFQGLEKYNYPECPS